MSTDPPRQPSGTARRMAVNTVSLAIGGIVAQLCFVAIEAIVARSLGASDYGAFSAVYAIALTSVLIVELGLGWKLIEEGSRNPAMIAPVLGTSLVLKLVTAAVVYPLVIGLLPVLGYSRQTVMLFAIVFFYPLMLVMQDSFAAVFSARQRMHVNALFQSSTPIVILLIVLFALAGSASIELVGAAYVAGSLVITLIWGWYTFREQAPAVDMRRAGWMLRGSYLYALTSMLQQLSFRLDVLFLSAMRSMGEVGLFASADRIADVGLKAAIMGSRVVAPVLFKQSRESRQTYESSCALVVRVAAILGVAGAIGLATLAKPVMLAVFGAAFEGSVVILVLLCASMSLRALAIALQTVLMSADVHARRTSAMGATLATAGLCNVALIPSFGVIGAAAARIAGDLVQIVVLLSSPKLPVRRSHAVRWIATPAVIGALSCAAGWNASSNVLLQLMLVFAVFAIGLYATGSLNVAAIRQLVIQVRAR